MSQWVDRRHLRIGQAQINTTVGDFTGNRRKILDAIGEARSLGVNLLTFPELAICGYRNGEIVSGCLIIDFSHYFHLTHAGMTSRKASCCEAIYDPNVKITSIRINNLQTSNLLTNEKPR